MTNQQTGATGDNIDLITMVCAWFFNRKLWIQLAKKWIKHPNPNKGMLILGDVGTGKTLAYEIAHSLMRLCGKRTYRMVKVGKFWEYAQKRNIDERSFDRFCKARIILDDLGYEKSSLSFVAKKAGQVILDNLEECPWLQPHGTSNLKLGFGNDTFFEVYGKRTDDRLYLLFNVIELTNHYSLEQGERASFRGLGTKRNVWFGYNENMELANKLINQINQIARLKCFNLDSSVQAIEQGLKQLKAKDKYLRCWQQIEHIGGMIDVFKANPKAYQREGNIKDLINKTKALAKGLNKQ